MTARVTHGGVRIATAVALSRWRSSPSPVAARSPYPMSYSTCSSPIRRRKPPSGQLQGTEWHDGDWIFAQPNGAPIDPRRDHDDWKKPLQQAGVSKGRLHDARHTAATALLILGVPERAVMEFMGWSSTGMTRRYQHVTGVVQRDVAERINGYLWSEK